MWFQKNKGCMGCVHTAWIVLVLSESIWRNQIIVFLANQKSVFEWFEHLSKYNDIEIVLVFMNQYLFPYFFKKNSDWKYFYKIKKTDRNIFPYVKIKIQKFLKVLFARKKTTQLQKDVFDQINPFLTNLYWLRKLS